MPLDTIGENPSITLRSNWLTVNGATMRADVLKDTRSDKVPVTPETLGSVLAIGRLTLLNGIEDFYDQQIVRNPDSTVVRPSIWTAQLGTSSQTDGRNSQVFTEKGYANGGINGSPDEIQERFRGYWDAVRNTGFLPEVRRVSGNKDGGAWLLLRKPTLIEVLDSWLGYDQSTFKQAIEIIKNDDMAIERHNLHLYRALGEKAIEQVPVTEYPLKQVTLILSIAAIKSMIGDTEGYEEEVDDALTLMHGHKDLRTDTSTIMAIENSTF